MSTQITPQHIMVFFIGASILSVASMAAYGFFVPQPQHLSARVSCGAGLNINGATNFSLINGTGHLSGVNITNFKVNVSDCQAAINGTATVPLWTIAMSGAGHN